MKKIIILCMFILLFSGCTAKYELDINKDLSLVESITGLEDDSFYNLFVSSKSKVIDMVISPYKRYLDIRKYSRNEFEENSLYGATYTKKFNSLDEFTETSHFYNQYYEEFNISKDGNLITIEALKPLGEEANFSNRIRVDDGTISIKLPFKVIDHNADSVDKKNNIYSWKFDLNNAKKVFIKFDSKKILDGNSYDKFFVIFSVVLGLIFIIGIIYIFKKRQNYRNNI